MNYPFPRSGFRPRLNTVVISIHASARVEWGDVTEFPFAVAFGDEESDRNVCSVLNCWPEKQTQYRALLEALLVALRVCKIMIEDKELPYRYPTFVIKTNNMTLIRSMVEWIWDWVNERGAKANGKPVEHWDVIQEIHDTILELETDHAHVLFWKVDRADIADADDLLDDPAGDYDVHW